MHRRSVCLRRGAETPVSAKVRLNHCASRVDFFLRVVFSSEHSSASTLVDVQKWILFSYSVQLPKDTLQPPEELLPAVLCAPISLLLIGTEAGLLHANVRAASRGSQGEEHDPLKPGFASSNTPVIGQALEWIDDEYLAVDNTIPVRHGIGSELELPPDHWLEVVVHHPLREERAFGERSPQLFWRMWEYALDHKGAGILCCVAH